MKGFVAALAAVVLLVTGVILLSHIGIARMDDYLSSLPEEELSLTEAEASLTALGERIENDLLLLNTILPHDRVDDLREAVARALAAAEGGDEAEYRILRGELHSLLINLQCDLTPRPSDIV